MMKSFITDRIKYHRNLQSFWFTAERKSHFSSKSRRSIFPFAVCLLSSPIRLSSILSIHQTAHNALFSACLHTKRGALCLASGQLPEWDGVTKIVEKCHPGMNYWWTERPSLSLPRCLRAESHAVKQQKNKESSNASIRYVFFLRPLLICLPLKLKSLTRRWMLFIYSQGLPESTPSPPPANKESIRPRRAEGI